MALLFYTMSGVLRQWLQGRAPDALSAHPCEAASVALASPWLDAEYGPFQWQREFEEDWFGDLS